MPLCSGSDAFYLEIVPIWEKSSFSLPALYYLPHCLLGVLHITHLHSALLMGDDATLYSVTLCLQFSLSHSYQ